MGPQDFSFLELFRWGHERPAQDDSRANRYPHDGVVKVCQLAPLDRDGQRDSDRQLAAVRIRLDFVALFSVAAS